MEFILLQKLKHDCSFYFLNLSSNSTKAFYMGFESSEGTRLAKSSTIYTYDQCKLNGELLFGANGTLNSFPCPHASKRFTVRFPQKESEIFHEQAKSVWRTSIHYVLVGVRTHESDCPMRGRIRRAVWKLSDQTGVFF